MKWSEKAWVSIEPIYRKTVELPFIKELMAGTLEREKFVFYIQQDSLYLSDYGKALMAVAAKLTEPKHVEAFIGFAGESIQVENELHKMLFAEFQADRQQTPSPSCLLYTSFLLRQLCEPVEVMAAAVLPCFRIYKEVGDYILSHQTKGDNPYQAWIDAYGGEEFTESVKKACGICDDLAEKCTPEQQHRMTDAFIACSKMEWMFWDSAYNLEQWKI
jgi:thiaminase/transcriptional activator TenA